MARQVLALQLVPDKEFAELLSELRAGDRETRIIALAAADNVPGADETIDWRGCARGPLLAELRSREFDAAVIAHGLDHYATSAYWKAVLLARAVRPRDIALYEGGATARKHSAGAGVRRAFMHILQECVAGVLGLVVLLPLVLGAVVTDVFARMTGRPRQDRERGKEKIR
ncbi:MAG: hypothetical protein JXA57_15060 [Armatimonadetes bacterium]|nr:hypothetical protein [Armatimonadota bacterium]